MRLHTVSGDGAPSLLDEPKPIRLASILDPALGTLYQRYKIVTKPAPARKKLPSPFDPRVSKIGLARILLKEALGYGLKLRKKEYRRALVSRPCIYGTFSGPLGGFHPIKEKCTGCMRCVQEYPGVCSVDRNPEFYRFADSYCLQRGRLQQAVQLWPQFCMKPRRERYQSKGWGTREHSLGQAGIRSGLTCLKL